MSAKENVSFRKLAHPRNSDEGQGWETTDKADTLNVYDNSESRTPTLILENHPADSRVKICEDGVFQSLTSRMGTGGNNVPMVLENSSGKGIAGTLDASYYKGCGNIGGGHEREVIVEKKQVNETVVRRLTPLECERLQGYPDFWTSIGEWTDSKGKKHKDADSPRYKALGNSIALPFWEWMAGRIAKKLREDGVENPTMGSLFDGIGGFPLVFSRNGVTPVWASEIEEFPIAVTKIRFPEESEKRGVKNAKDYYGGLSNFTDGNPGECRNADKEGWS